MSDFTSARPALCARKFVRKNKLDRTAETTNPVPTAPPPPPSTPPPESEWRPLVSPLPSPDEIDSDTMEIVWSGKSAYSNKSDIPPTPVLVAAPRLLKYFRNLDEDALEYEVVESSPKKPGTPAPPSIPPPAFTPLRQISSSRKPLRDLLPQSVGRSASICHTNNKVAGGRHVPPSPADSDLASPAPLEVSDITRALLGAADANAAPDAAAMIPTGLLNSLHERGLALGDAPVSAGISENATEASSGLVGFNSSIHNLSDVAGGRSSVDSFSEHSRTSVGSAHSSVGGDSSNGSMASSLSVGNAADSHGLKRFGLTGGPARRLICGGGSAQRSGTNQQNSKIRQSSSNIPPSSSSGPSRRHLHESPHVLSDEGEAAQAACKVAHAQTNLVLPLDALQRLSLSTDENLDIGGNMSGGDLSVICEEDIKEEISEGSMRYSPREDLAAPPLSSPEHPPPLPSPPPPPSGCLYGGGRSNSLHKVDLTEAPGEKPELLFSLLDCDASESIRCDLSTTLPTLQSIVLGDESAEASSVVVRVDQDSKNSGTTREPFDVVSMYQLSWWLILPWLDSWTLIHSAPAVCRRLRSMCAEAERMASVLSCIAPPGSKETQLPSGGPMIAWSQIERAFPMGRSLAQGGYKTVFLVSEAEGGLDNPDDGEGISSHLRAMGVVDVRALQRKGLEASLRTELWVSHLLGKLAALGRCPHYLQLHAMFRSAEEPPNEWRYVERSDSPANRSSSDSGDTDVNTLRICAGRPRRTARKPTNSRSRDGGPCFQYVVMQYAEGGDMEEACKSLAGMAWPPEMVPQLFFQMLFSLHVAQVELQLRHFDIKLLNFFLTSPLAVMVGEVKGASFRTTANGIMELSRSIPADDQEEIRIRYAVQGNEYLLDLDAHTPTLALLADFGTADLSPDSLGAPVTAANFTTLENTPPEFLLCGARARQTFGADAWGLGLCLLHLLTGRAPYEELLEAVRCPKDLRLVLQMIWTGGDSPNDITCGDYTPVAEILDADDGGVLADTLYRYICLFGPLDPASTASSRSYRSEADVLTEQHINLDGSPAWRAVQSWLDSPAGSRRYCRDAAKWSAYSGSAEPLTVAQRRMASIPGSEELLRGLTAFDPAYRWSVRKAFASEMFEPLRQAAGKAPRGEEALLFADYFA